MFRYRFLGTVAFFLVTSPALAHPPGQVVSYHLPDGVNDRDIVPTVPTGGLVITDIVYAAPSSQEFHLEQVDGAEVVEKFFKIGQTGQDLHLQSGIVFDAGSTIRVNVANGTRYTYTISGYIPTTSSQGNVPAVSTWGLVVLGLLVVSAGSVVAMRRKLSG